MDINIEFDPKYNNSTKIIDVNSEYSLTYLSSEEYDFFSNENLTNQIGKDLIDNSSKKNIILDTLKIIHDKALKLYNTNFIPLEQSFKINWDYVITLDDASVDCLDRFDSFIINKIELNFDSLQFDNLSIEQDRKSVV